MKNNSLLTVKNLEVCLTNSLKSSALLNNISFQISKNQIVGLVGESGSGKSLTALSILNLLNNKTYSSSGKILFKGENILELSLNELQKIRGVNSIYHNNSIATWLVSKNGKVDNVRLG